jgi:hypothetical protein
LKEYIPVSSIVENMFGLAKKGTQVTFEHKLGN